MSVIIFLQEQAQLTIPVWQGLTGLGVVSSISVAMYNISNSKLSKKVDKEVFKEHKEADEQAHKAISDTMKSIDANVKMLVQHHISNKE